MCNTLWSQTAHCGVRIENLAGLVAFKGTIRRNPFRGEHFYYERQFFLFTKPKILTPRCHARDTLPLTTKESFSFEQIKCLPFEEVQRTKYVKHRGRFVK